MVDTWFETTGDWTPLAQEATFLTAVAAAAPAGRVTHTTIGTSTIDGHPLRRVVVTDAPAGAPVILIVGGVHGHEKAGREAAFTLIRDLAESTDPAWVSIRKRARFVFLPNTNPTGFDRDTGPCWVNATTQLDIQNDLMRLRMNESKVIQQTITDYKPVLGIDCHEYSQIPAGPIAFRPSTINPWNRAEAVDLWQAVRDHLDAQSIDHRLYDQNIGPQYMSVRSMFTLRGATGLLIETCWQQADLPGRQARVAQYAAAFEGVIGWISENLGRLTTVQGEVRAGIRHAVTSRTVPLDLITGTVLDSWPQGYSSLSEWPELFTIAGVQGDTTWVPADQPEGLLVVRTLDPDTYRPFTPVGLTAKRSMPTPPRPAPPGTILDVTVNDGHGPRSVAVGETIDGVVYRP